MLNIELRNLIKSHLESGKNASQINLALNKTVPKSTLYRWINHINKTISSKKQPGRPRSVRTKKFIRQIKRNAKLNKKRKSARLIAKEMRCSDATIRRAIKNDLSLKAYKQIKVPMLTPSHIDQRRKFANWVRKNFDKGKCRKILFSDEKCFDGDGQFNPKNDIIYAESREEANNNGGLFPKRKYPYKVMVWVGITYNGPTQVVTLPLNTSFDTEFYTHYVLPVARRDGLKLIGNDFIYQQDNASCHTSEESVNWVINEMPDAILPTHWPANSPDLNPLDYFFWNEVSQRLTKTNFSNRHELITKIKL